MRGVIAAATADASSANPSAADVATATGIPPASATAGACAAYDGSGTITSSPASITVRAARSKPSDTPVVISSSEPGSYSSP